MAAQHVRKYSLKYFRVIWEDKNPSGAAEKGPELAPRVNRQLSKATERNRIKRILREFWRGHLATFKRGRWVFIAKRRVERVPNREVWHDLETILQRVSQVSF